MSVERVTFRGNSHLGWYKGIYPQYKFLRDFKKAKKLMAEHIILIIPILP
jgi:hypothetical protein